MNHPLFLYCSLFVIAGLASIVRAEQPPARQFLLDGWNLELRAFREPLENAFHRKTLSLVLKGGEGAGDRLVWSRSYFDWGNATHLPGLDLFDVAREGNRLHVLNADGKAVYLDTVDLSEPDKELATSIFLFERNAGWGPSASAGRLLLTKQGIHAIFDISNGKLEVWSIKDGKPERVWSQRAVDQ